TFPVMPVNGYMISGMLTRGKNCEDGVLCAPKLSEVEGGAAVYPESMKPELLKNVGDFYIDCERMPSAEQLRGHEAEVIDAWLKRVDVIREQQTKLFDYLLKNHPTDFTWMVQSCEDRTGHWLYPIAPYNVGYNAKIKHDLRLMGFEASVYDVAPTILHIYGIAQPEQMRGHELTQIFEGGDNKVAEK